jgi:hypothetical protein
MEVVRHEAAEPSHALPDQVVPVLQRRREALGGYAQPERQLHHAQRLLHKLGGGLRAGAFLLAQRAFDPVIRENERHRHPGPEPLQPIEVAVQPISIQMLAESGLNLGPELIPSLMDQHYVPWRQVVGGRRQAHHIEQALARFVRKGARRQAANRASIAHQSVIRFACAGQWLLFVYLDIAEWKRDGLGQKRATGHQ